MRKGIGTGLGASQLVMELESGLGQREMGGNWVGDLGYPPGPDRPGKGQRGEDSEDTQQRQPRIGKDSQGQEQKGADPLYFVQRLSPSLA